MDIYNIFDESSDSSCNSSEHDDVSSLINEYKKLDINNTIYLNKHHTVLYPIDILDIPLLFAIDEFKEYFEHLLEFIPIYFELELGHFKLRRDVSQKMVIKNLEQIWIQYYGKRDLEYRRNIYIYGVETSKLCARQDIKCEIKTIEDSINKQKHSTGDYIEHSLTQKYEKINKLKTELEKY